MMKVIIGIMGDTHDNLTRIREAVTFLNTLHCGLVLHTGDFIAPFVIPVLGRFDAPLIGVFGNNDGDKGLLLRKCAEEVCIEIRGTFAERCRRKTSASV